MAAFEKRASQIGAKFATRAELNVERAKVGYRASMTRVFLNLFGNGFYAATQARPRQRRGRLSADPPGVDPRSGPQKTRCTSSRSAGPPNSAGSTTRRSAHISHRTRSPISSPIAAPRFLLPRKRWPVPSLHPLAGEEVSVAAAAAAGASSGLRRTAGDCMGRSPLRKPRVPTP